MEHFYLPLGMWMVGILISLLCFIAEIIKHRKTDVPMAKSTAESENPGGMVLVLNKWKAAELDLAVSENIEDIEDTKVKI